MGSSTMCLGRGSFSRNTQTRKQAVQGAGCSKETTEFVNHGLLLWNQSRQQWVGEKKATSRTRFLRMLNSSTPHLCMARNLWLCCMDPSKGTLKLLKSSEPFPKPIPLGEMVDFLVDVWEEEGMYDMV
ncbi:hypothetical protein C2S52_001119 [Perilla frutescens var. hirtella]|uniref:Gag1-like clamp domain-containing protein n=1 Tax=Perilla frutescens var. hirtella TaxID=608512 RepID=A0AAD4PB46_PERFH|nr:hypothetical protein C2S51_007354 [Perilla frutescens var. frutescens]KAH6800655.1 hypothetical protein C2S52_001119 [Perilla frutescens var. hirtella]KAH6832347.1 hypothetical protein C2S53_001755 [Perilla frutescens var. hirtella]